MKNCLLGVVAGFAILNAVPASASPISLNLANYAVAGVYALDTTFGVPGVSGLEASAVTYASDRGTLFFVGDEGTGVVEISLTGQTLGAMAFNWAGTASTNNDTEGLTYLGGGSLVVAEERLQNAYSFTYASGGAVSLASAPFVSIGPTIGNVGIEGLSYDPRNGNFVTAKQDNPAQLRIFPSLSFATTAAPDAVPSQLFSGASSLFGLLSLSDVQTLAIVQSLAGGLAADNLLVLSLDSRMLIEIDRLGNVLSSLSLAGVLPRNGIEGVTVDEHGTIYLVAEQDQLPGAPANAPSQLIVLKPVPEPGTYALMLSGLGMLGLSAVRRRQTATRQMTR